jgi:predicted ATPase
MRTKLIVITGGPGAGKSAVLEMAKKIFKGNTIILPEAASIIYGGGFFRLPSVSAKAATQRAIYHVQHEMENVVLGEKQWAIGLCDRGTLDGLSYWPLPEQEFWKSLNSTLKEEYARYHAVIHMHSPTDEMGYNHQNPLRIETALEAHLLDERIAQIWGKHPRYHSIKSNESFLTKAQMALDIIKQYEEED